MDALLATLSGLPPPALLAVLGLGAALENLVPPVPADTFVLLGGFLSGRGSVGAWPVFWVTWGANVSTALVVYAVGHRYGRRFFQHGLGRKILAPRQLVRLEHFYHRFGVWAIFLARFLPGLRAVVPAFAGVSHRPVLPVAIPVALASAIWYGGLVWLGAKAGRNLDQILAWIVGANRALLSLTVLIALVLGFAWMRSRHDHE